MRREPRAAPAKRKHNYLNLIIYHGSGYPPSEEAIFFSKTGALYSSTQVSMNID